MKNQIKRIKKTTIFLFCFMICTNILAQRVKRKGVEPIDISKTKKSDNKTPVFTINQLMGKWKEVGRIEKPTSQIAFTDTLLLNFISSDSVTSKQGKQVMYKGSAEIAAPGNVLLVAGDVYTVLSIAADKIVLDNQENFIHTLIKSELIVE